MAFLDQNPGLGYPAAAAFGLALGSFLNVVILRLPRRLEWQWQRDSREILGEPEAYDPPPPGIVVEPSHCPHCKHKLAWYEKHFPGRLVETFESGELSRDADELLRARFGA